MRGDPMEQGKVGEMRAARNTLRSAAALQASGLIPPDRVAEIEQVAARYALALTPAMADLIDPADADDPIARQFIPDPAELEIAPEERADPIGDDAHSPVEGIVHRYPDRVLLKLVHVCAVYCRFCFRRETVGQTGSRPLLGDRLEAALAYIRAHREIWEVILTGGDPLVLSARRLAAAMKRLSTVEHVKIIRLHTRIPIVDPERVTPALIRAMKTQAKATYVVIHANHPRELTPAARVACGRLVDAGIPVLSQSVLLRGINDDVETLGALLRGLVECRVKPYYLHHGDLAPGTAHLRTSITVGQEIMRALHGRYSGLCQPTYVLDIPGGHGKSPIGPCYAQAADDDRAIPHYQIEDFQGQRHPYPPARSPGSSGQGR
jgi:lysine 2,3-aminomutase